MADTYLRTIYLHGALGRKYGKVFHMDVQSAAEAIRALSTQLRGFRNDFAKGYFKIVWKLERKIYMTREATTMVLGKGPIHILPVLAGASSKATGIFMAIAGAALLATAFILAPGIDIAFVGAIPGAANLSATAISLGSLGAITYGNIATLGFGLLLLGAGAMLSPSVNTGNASSSSSGMFTEPENVSSQGLAVPLIYGRWLAGSIVVATAIQNVNVVPGTV